MSVVTTRTVLTSAKKITSSSCHKTLALLQAPQVASARLLSSSFVSHGLVSENIKLFSKLDDDFPEIKKEVKYVMKEPGLVSRTIRRNSSSFKLHAEDNFPEIKPKETKIVIKEPSANIGGRSPLVLVFGWGGASHKNLAKYSALYLGVGCTTVQ